VSIIDRTVDPTAVVDHHTSEPLLKRLTSLQSVWILGVLLVIVVFFSIAAGGKFLSPSNFSLISQNIAVWAVLGVGMTFVIITAGIDLSIGSVLVFSSVVAAKVMAAMGGDGWGVAAIGIVTALTEFNTYIKILGIPALPFVALITVVIGGIVLHKTKFGRYTYAVGSNELGARRVGINVDRHLIMVYALSGTMAGLGAVLALSQFGTTTIAGQSLTNLNVIAAVVIGGTSIFGGEGSIFGTVVGLFIPAVLQAGFVIIGVEAFWQGVAVGTVLVAAVYVDQSRRAAALRGAKPRKPISAIFKPNK